MRGKILLIATILFWAILLIDMTKSGGARFTNLSLIAAAGYALAWFTIIVWDVIKKDKEIKKKFKDS